jgi:hypothetical protein
MYIFDEVLHAYHDLLLYILHEFHLTFVLKDFFHFHQNENLLLDHIKYYHYEFQLPRKNNRLNLKKKGFAEIKLEYQLHVLELLFVSAFLNHQLLIVYVDGDHVDEIFHQELMI